MRPSHVLLGAAALVATAAGAYTIGVRRGAPPPATTASASESGARVARQAPELDNVGDKSAERRPRRPRQRVAEVSNSAEEVEARISDALAALSSGSSTERARGLVALAKDDRLQAVARARGFLDDPKMIRAASTVLLASGGAPEEVGKEIPAVRAALDKSSCDAETKTAVMGLVLQGANYANPAEARKLAVDLMASKSPEARRAATPLLQGLNADQAVPLLLAALDDPDPGVRQAALTTLRGFSLHDHGDSPEAWRAWWRSANRGR